jgi:branched-chain amino acid transport system permease protein
MGVANALLLVIAAALSLLFLIPPSTHYMQLVITEIVGYALVAIAFDLCFGFTGLLSLATALYFGLGAYFFVFGLKVVGMGIGASMIVSIVVVLGIGALTGAIAVQLRGAAFLVLTIILVTASYGLAQAWKHITGGDDGLVLEPALFHGLDRQFTPTDRYRLALSLFAVGFFATVALVRSPVGRLFRTVKQNEFRLELLGYSATTIKLIAFCWAAVLAAMGGIIYCVTFQHVHTGLFHWSVSANALIWAFFGGLGSLTGPLIGVTVLLPFEDYMGSILGYPRLFSGLLLIAVVLINKEGLAGIVVNVSNLFRKTQRKSFGDHA